MLLIGRIWFWASGFLETVSVWRAVLQRGLQGSGVAGLILQWGLKRFGVAGAMLQWGLKGFGVAGAVRANYTTW